MTVNEITAIANNYTDENFNSSTTIDFVNSCIGQINRTVKANLPLVDDTTTDYDALTDDWILTVIVPYVCWSIKMNDGSLNEANVFFAQYSRGLDSLKKNKRHAIDKDYQGSGFDNTAQIKPYRNSWGGNKPRFRAHSDDPLGQRGDD